MNVGQLKKLLERVADNTPILLPSSDHSYREADFTVTTAVFDVRRKDWSEDFEYEEHSDSRGLSRRNVIAIS